MTTIKVSDMHCMHCQMNIEKALKRKHIKGTVSLENKEVVLDNDADKDAAIKAIQDSGYTPSL